MAPLSTKAWENENFFQKLKSDKKQSKVIPETKGDESTEPKWIPSLETKEVQQGRDLFNAAKQALDELNCFERAAVVIFEHLREKQKDPENHSFLIDKLKLSELGSLIDLMKRHGDDENLTTDDHNFGRIFRVGLPR